jgi:hypothetical protein
MSYAPIRTHDDRKNAVPLDDMRPVTIDLTADDDDDQDVVNLTEEGGDWTPGSPPCEPYTDDEDDDGVIPDRDSLWTPSSPEFNYDGDVVSSVPGQNVMNEDSDSEDEEPYPPAPAPLTPLAQAVQVLANAATTALTTPNLGFHTTPDALEAVKKAYEALMGHGPPKPKRQRKRPQKVRRRFLRSRRRNAPQRFKPQ